MNDLTDPAGIAALSAGAVALIALLLALVLAFRMRKLRSAQKAVLAEHRALRRAQPPYTHGEHEGEQEGDQRHGTRRHGGDARRIGQVVHEAEGYEAPGAKPGTSVPSGGISR